MYYVLTVCHPSDVSSGVTNSYITSNLPDSGAPVNLYNWNLIVPDALTIETLILLIFTASRKICCIGKVMVPPLSASLLPTIAGAFGTVIAENNFDQIYEYMRHVVIVYIAQNISIQDPHAIISNKNYILKVKF